MNDFWATLLDFAATTTGAVGERLLQDFGQVQASQKADGSLVTGSDQWADQALTAAILQRFPDHAVLSEEGKRDFPDTFFSEHEWCWIIDPIDGTTNFTRGLPIWGMSLGLLYQGTPVFGYASFPPLQQTFHGFWQAPDHPDGAFRNGQPIHTRCDPPDKNQFFSLCARSTAVLKQPFPCKIRMLGSASYNFLTVAAGATLGGVEATPRIWDLAAVWPILHAAGGHWVSLAADPPFPIEVANPTNPSSDTSFIDRAYPTLITARSELVPLFLPLVQCIVR